MRLDSFLDVSIENGRIRIDISTQGFSGKGHDGYEVSFRPDEKRMTLDIDLDSLGLGVLGYSGPELMEKVIGAVCTYYNIEKAELLSKRRSQPYAQIRQIAMYLCVENTNLPQKFIGEALGGRTHSTVSYAHQAIKEQAQIYPNIGKAIAAIENSMKEERNGVSVDDYRGGYRDSRILGRHSDRQTEGVETGEGIDGLPQTGGR